MQSENKEQFIAYLKSIGRLDEACVQLAGIINNEEFISRDGKSKHQVGVICNYLIGPHPPFSLHILYIHS